jgi:hypothetical protein
MNQDLVEIMVNGTIKATLLHSRANGLAMPDNQTFKHRLKQVIGNEWEDFLHDVKQAIVMGDEMGKHCCNIYCNSWAVKILKAETAQ